MKSFEHLSHVWLHTHSRLDDRLLDAEQRRIEYETHEGQLSSDALVWLARKTSENQAILVGDTDHPVHILDRMGIKRKGSFSRGSVRRTIEILSDGVLERATLLRGIHNILTGVEVDILSPDGLLDIDDTAFIQDIGLRTPEHLLQKRNFFSV